MSAKKHSLKNSSGFTLIEVLIAILVFAVGLLALAGLQLQTLRYSNSAGMRTVATMLATSINDRIVANRSGLKSGYYNAMSSSDKTSISTATCFTTGCSTQAMAVLDLVMWDESIAKVLPNGVGIVCIDSTPNDGTAAAPACDNVAGAPYVIKIWWTDDRSSNAAANVTRFVTSLQP